MKTGKLFSFYLMGLFGAVILASGCATTSKRQAVAFLKQCDFEITDVELRDVSLDDTAVLSVIQQLMNGRFDRSVGYVNVAVRLQVENRGCETLLVDRLEGEILLDTLLRSPTKLVGTALVPPGMSVATLETSLPLDPNLFNLANAQHYRLRGSGSGTLQSNNRRIELEFDEERPVPDKIKQRLKSARQMLLEELMSGLFP